MISKNAQKRAAKARLRHLREQHPESLELVYALRFTASPSNPYVLTRPGG